MVKPTKKQRRTRATSSKERGILYLQQLIEPPDSIPEQLRPQARLLFSLIIFQLFFLVFLYPLVLFLARLDFPIEYPILIAGIMILGLAFLLGRRGHYTPAAFITIFVSAILTWGFAIAQSKLTAVMVMVIGFASFSIMLCGLLLTGKVTLLLTALHLAGIAVSAFIFPDKIDFFYWLTLSIFIGTIAALTIITTTMRKRDQDEILSHYQSLREAEERFRLISYATNDVITDWDMTTGKVWRNTTTQRMFGFRSDQIKPDIKWWEELIHPLDREKVIRSLRAAIDGGGDFWSNEYRFRCADERYIYVFDRAYIIRNEAGKPIRMLGTTMDITDSMHDPLTGLYNRRYMEEMFQREILRARRIHQPISLILIDLDNFKQVNDTLGHAAGDALLRALGNFLRMHIRGADIACRFGGDEFMLALPGATLQAAMQRADAMRKGCRGLQLERFGAPPEEFSISMGIATYPQHGQNRDTLFDAADKALYTAKQQGRNCVVAAPGNDRRNKL